MSKIFLFDVDGVIVGDYDYESLYKSLQCTVSFEDFKKIYSKCDEYYKCEKGLITFYEFAANVKEKIGSNIDAKEFSVFHKNCKGEFYPNTISLIKTLKKEGYKVGLLSNLKEIDIEFLKENLDIEFDYEFYSCRMHMMKPDDEIFAFVATETSAMTNDVYFFDNLLVNCEASSKYGLKSICTTGDNIEKSFKKYVN